MKPWINHFAVVVATCFSAPSVAASNLPLVIQSGQTKQLPAGTTLATQPSTTGGASITIPQGTAPTSPNNGDCWITSAGFFCRVNGATVGPMTGIAGSTAVYAGQYGADNTCTNDAAPGIAAAFAATTGAVILSGCYRASSTVIVPNGRGLIGNAYEFINPVGSNTTKIVCDAGVSPCVQLGNGGSNSGESLRNVVVDRVGGTPDASSVGVQVLNGYNSSIVDVFSHNHGICFQATSDPGIGVGISLMMTRVFSGACLTTHVDIDSWPEIRIEQSRFGMNGAGDYAATSYIRIRGGVPGTAGGPNGLVVVNTQFNQGLLTVTNFLNYVQLNGAVPSIDAGNDKFIGDHIEAVSGAIIHSDSTWNALPRLTMSGNTFNAPSAKFTDLNVATKVSEWSLSDNLIFVNDFTLAPTDGLNQFY